MAHPEPSIADLSREDELAALDLLSNQNLIPEYMADRRWKPLYALACFLHSDAPVALAVTDPAKYRMLRRHVTEARISGWLLLNPPELAKLAESQ